MNLDTVEFVVQKIFSTVAYVALGLFGLYVLEVIPTTREQPKQITCQSADLIHTDCVVKYQGIFRSSESEKVIKDVKGVRLYRDEGSHNEDGHASIFYGVRLQTKSDYFGINGCIVKGIEDVREMQDLRNRFQEYIEYPRGSLTIPFDYYSGDDILYIVAVCVAGPEMIMLIVFPFVSLITDTKYRLQSVSRNSERPLTIQSGCIALIRFILGVCVLTSPITLIFLASLSSSPIDPYLSQGEDFYQNKDYDRAIDAFSEALKSDPQNASIYVRRGLAFADKKNYDRALVDYNEALKLDPKNADVYIDRGNVFDAQKDHNRALAEYNQALKLDKNVY